MTDRLLLPGPRQVVDLNDIRPRALDFLTELATQFGDLFAYRVSVAGEPEEVVVVNHPDIVGVVLRSDVHSYSKEHTPDHLMLGPLLGDGLLTSNGAAWRSSRRDLAPLFRPAAVVGFDEIMTGAAESLARRWNAAPGPRVVDHDLSGLTLTILVEAIFGSDAARVGSGFGRAVDAINAHLVWSGQPGTETRLAYTQAVRLVHGVTDALIAAFSRAGGQDSAVLERLRSSIASPSLLHDQVLTLVMAGHETTAKSLGWALWLLGRDTEMQDRISTEAETVAGGGPLGAEHVSELRWTTAAVQEAMRLYPPIWMTSRRACRDTVLDGHRLPAGTLVCFSQWLVHRDVRWWGSGASDFDPGRFLRPHARPAFSYFPFGGGERTCIGQHFALLETVLTLATLLRHCAVRTDEEATPEALVTLRAVSGCRLDVVPRRDHPRVGASMATASAGGSGA